MRISSFRMSSYSQPAVEADSFDADRQIPPEMQIDLLNQL